MKNRGRIEQILVLLALALAAVVVSPGPSAGADAPAGPRRVASLVPFAADAVARLPEARAVVVARVRSTPSEAVAGAADLGSPHGPSFEVLAASRPDLILADAAMHAALVPRLEPVAPVLLLDGSSVDSTFESLLRVGRAVGADPEMQTEVDAARRALATQAQPEATPVLPLFATARSFLVVTDRTWFGDLLGTLNFQNLAAGQVGRESHPGFVQVSDETIATLRPRHLLVIAHGDPAAVRASLAERMEDGGPWSALGAEGRVHVLDATRFGTNPGLDLPSTARELRARTAGDEEP